MRTAGLLRPLAAIALLACLVLGLSAYLSFRSALGAKIDRAALIQQEITRPAAAARLASLLLERRLASVAEPGSQAIAAAFRHADAVSALADYRAAGGNPAIVAEAQKFLSLEKPGPDSDVALMRAIRGLRGEAAAAPRALRPEPPLSASQAAIRLLGAGAAAVIALLFAYLSGRFERNRESIKDHPG